MSKLLHVAVDQKLRDRMDVLVKEGLFTNHVEIVREGVRDLLEKQLLLKKE